MPTFSADSSRKVTVSGHNRIILCRKDYCGKKAGSFMLLCKAVRIVTYSIPYAEITLHAAAPATPNALPEAFALLNYCYAFHSDKIL